MVDNHERLREDLAAYALGALEPAECARVEAHLRDCPECATLLNEYQSVGGLLPYALKRHAPARETRTALLVKVRAGTAPTSLRPVAPPDEMWRRLMVLVQPLRWAVVTVALASLVVWNLQLQRQVGRLRDAVEITQVARLPEGRIIALRGTGTPGASARLFVSTDGRRGELAITGLAPLLPERVYQLWFARPGQPTITGGAFRVNSYGDVVVAVTIPVPLEDVRAIAVTEEAAPRVPSPTGTHLLDGRP